MMNFAPKLHTEKLKHLSSSEGEKQCCLKRRFIVTIEGDHWGRRREERREGVRKSNRWKVREERSLRESWLKARPGTSREDDRAAFVYILKCLMEIKGQKEEESGISGSEVPQLGYTFYVYLVLYSLSLS